MKLEVIVKQVDNKNILLIDNSRINNKYPSFIDSFKLDIIGITIPNGGVFNIDVISYLRQNKVDNELFRISSEVIGLQSGMDIPDGIYYCTLKINNTEVCKIDFVVLNEIMTEMKELASTLSKDVTVFEDDIRIDTSVSNNTIMKFNYAVSLYYDLLINVNKVNSYSKVNDDIDLLRRVLTIVKRQVNGGIS